MPSEYQHATARPASLEEETRTVIGEARMVLPGIQAFFGFHLIAVFNNRFQDLTHTEQVLHFIALLLLAVSIALIMTPAAVDLFLLTRFILDSSTLSAVVGIVTILMFFGLWYLFPWTQKLCARRGHSGSPKA